MNRLSVRIARLEEMNYVTNLPLNAIWKYYLLYCQLMAIIHDKIIKVHAFKALKPLRTSIVADLYGLQLHIKMPEKCYLNNTLKKGITLHWEE